jgi:hypothetical protein
MTHSIKGLFVTLSIMALDIEYCYTECQNLFIIMLNVIMLNVVMLSVVMQKVVAPLVSLLNTTLGH